MGTRPSRLLFVHSGSDLYGASRSLLRLTTRIAADGHEVMTVLPHDGPLRPALEAAGVQAIVDQRLVMLTRKGVFPNRSRVQQLIDLPLSVAALVKICREFKPDLMHTNTAVIVSSPLAAQIARVPHIWHMREFFVDFPRAWPAHREFMTRCSERVICVSAAVAAQFRTGTRNLRVLNNGFPAGEFEPATADRIAAFRARFGVQAGVLVGIVGRIKFKRKGQETFVRAAALLAKQHPGVRFMVIGSPFPGNEEHLVRLRALITELGIEDSVVLTGDVDDVKAAYAALDITVLASTSPEPFGGVVIEAMAMGIPVVGTNVGGTPEQIAHGHTGLLVPPDAPRPMADAIERLLVDPPLREQMGRAARARFLAEFEFEPFYQRLWGIYSEVLR